MADAVIQPERNALDAQERFSLAQWTVSGLGLRSEGGPPRRQSRLRPSRACGDDVLVLNGGVPRLAADVDDLAATWAIRRLES